MHDHRPAAEPPAEDFESAFRHQWQLAEAHPGADTMRPLLAMYRRNQRERLIEQPSEALARLLSADTGLITVLACYYNYSRNPKRLESFKRFHERLTGQGARVLVAELSISGEFELDGFEDVHRLHHPHAMWHEEGLYQHLLAYLPPACEVVCRADWRVGMHDGEWLIDLYEASEHHRWLQPFDKISGGQENDGPTAQYLFAVRREVLEPTGFYTAAISGAAGAVMFGGAPLPPGVCAEDVERWRAALTPQIETLDGLLYLSGPGDIPERFAGLGEILQRHQFDPRHHLSQTGPLHTWNFPDPATNQTVNREALEWFCERKL